MPQKKNAVQFWFRKDLVEEIEETMKREGTRMKRTPWIEQELYARCRGQTVHRNEVSTEKLFMTMYALGMMNQKRLEQLLVMVRSGALSSSVPEDKFEIGHEAALDPKNKT